ncbi:hypothetical protein F5Y15DRAFT_385270 [Xylariaceae sp. FL0016]|nr:hypothetical protein F5Y15DRAFT_385270 [Xylariaceae sp. FL0016]
MVASVPPLRKLVLTGFHGGLRWETKGYTDQGASDLRTHYQRNLLLFSPHSFNIAKILFKNSPEKSHPYVRKHSYGNLAKIYEFATEHVELCDKMEPQEFFAYAKNSWKWPEKLKDDAFWAFTYKLFHARALFLDTVSYPHHDPPCGNPLVLAVDKFKAKFLELYDPNTSREIHITSRYFGLSEPDCEGDGSDGLIKRMCFQPTPTPISAKRSTLITLPRKTRPPPKSSRPC